LGNDFDPSTKNSERHGQEGEAIANEELHILSPLATDQFLGISRGVLSGDLIPPESVFAIEK
jgi:hypothetical protein